MKEVRAHGQRSGHRRPLADIPKAQVTKRHSLSNDFLTTRERQSRPESRCRMPCEPLDGPEDPRKPARCQLALGQLQYEGPSMSDEVSAGLESPPLPWPTPLLGPWSSVVHSPTSPRPLHGRPRPNDTGAPMAYAVFTLDQRPELRSHFRRFHNRAWPEFLQDDLLNASFSHIYEKFPAFQFGLWEASGRVVAVGNSIPFVWRGTRDRLPDRIVDVIAKGLRARELGRRPTALSALAAIVDYRSRGQDLSRRVIAVMAQIAARHGLKALVAPVRPMLPPRADGGLRRVASAGRHPVRSLAPRSLAARRPGGAHRAAGDERHRDGGGMGGEDGTTVPGERALRSAGRVQPDQDRSEAE